MTYKIPYSMIEVIWDDAASNSEAWVHKNDIEEPEQVVTLGFLIKEDDRAVYVASSVANDKAHEDTVGNTMTIPKGMIVSRRSIRIVNARSKSQHKLHPQPSAAPVHREPGEGGPVLK